MKKIVIGFFVFILLISTTVYADRGREDRDNIREQEYYVASSTRSEIKSKIRNASSTKELKNVDVTCVSTAISVREDAITQAWITFNEDITKIFSTRKNALVSAWIMGDSKDRRIAVKDAWAVAKKDKKSAALEYKNSKKTAWATYKTETKRCEGINGSEASGESEDGEKVEI